MQKYIREENSLSYTQTLNGHGDCDSRHCYFLPSPHRHTNKNAQRERHPV